MNPLTPISASLTTGPVPRVDSRGRGGHDAVQIAKDFESVLLTKVVEEMAKTVEDSSLAEDGAGEQVHALFYSQLAQDMAAKGGLGLWKQIARQIAARMPAGEPGQEVAQ